MKKQMPIPVGPGRGNLAQGYQPTIPEVAAQLAAETQSLKARLDAGDVEGEPATYQGVRVFTPENTSFLLDVNQDGGSVMAPVNYILRDGQAYDIPVLTPGPGVFVATGLTVAVFQRRYDPALPEAAEVNYNSYWTLFRRGVNYTCKFSLWPTQPSLVDSGAPPSAALNFFWNLSDARTGDLYSDQPLNHLALRPRQSVPELGHYSRSPYLDGGMFKFDTPWVFPYGTGAVFKFQPINPVLQYDSSVGPVLLPPPAPQAVTGLFYDDRENGKRNQSVSVKVVMHGYRMMVAPGV